MQCADINGTPTMPDDPPHVKIYRTSDGAVVYSREIPLLDKVVQVGLFQVKVFLNEAFAAGDHEMEVVWSISPATFMKVMAFSVMAGGDANGQVLGMTYYPLPDANFIVYQTENGTIFKGKNPVLP